MKDFKTLITVSHPPLGDNFCNNGLFRELLARRPEVKLMKICTFGQYLNDVSAMYRDEPRIKVYGVPDWNHCSRVLVPGLVSSGVNTLFLSSFDQPTWNALGQRFNWDQCPYEQAGVPFDYKWSKFQLSPHLLPRKMPAMTDTILVHEDPRRGMSINHRRLTPGRHVFITPRNSVWDWLPAILSAKELHFIDSSLLNLADLLRAGSYGLLKNTRLVYHAYARKSPPPVMRAPWDVLS